MKRSTPCDPPVTRQVKSGDDYNHLINFEGWVLAEDCELPSGEIVTGAPGKQWRVRVVPQPRPFPGKYPVLVQEDRPCRPEN